MGTPLTVFAYDVACDRRRERVRALLAGYGIAVQQSVFEAHLTRREREQVVRRARDILDVSADTLSLYTISAAAESQIQTIGRARPALAEETWFVV